MQDNGTEAIRQKGHPINRGDVQRRHGAIVSHEMCRVLVCLLRMETKN